MGCSSTARSCASRSSSSRRPGTGAGRRVSDVGAARRSGAHDSGPREGARSGNVRGRSLKSLLDGSGQLRAAPRLRRIVVRALSVRLDRARVGHRRALSLHPVGGDDELYDLEKDPEERRNIAERLGRGHSHPERRARGAAGRHVDSRSRTTCRLRIGNVSKRWDMSGLPIELSLATPTRRRTWPLSKRIELPSITTSGANGPRRSRSFRGCCATIPNPWTRGLRLAAVAERSGRHELALEAYRRVLALRPDRPARTSGAATALWRLRRLDEARQQPSAPTSLAGDDDVRLRGAAHELLARIALGRRDAETARIEADLAQQAEPGRPVRLFVEARLLQEQRRLQRGALDLRAGACRARSNEGTPDRGPAFLCGRRAGQALPLLRSRVALPRRAPRLSRSTHELAATWPPSITTMDRKDEAAAVLADLVRLTPTPEGFALAARMWQSFGNPRQAANLRSEAQRQNMRFRYPGQ